MKLNQYTIITASLLGFTVCSGAVLSSTTTFADNDSVTDEVQVTVPTSCTMTGNGQTSHTATIDPGIYSGNNANYTNGIGSTTLTMLCNDHNGFSVYAIGFTNDTAGNNTLQGTSVSGNATIASALYDSNSPTTSTWSMKVTAGRDTGDTTSPNNLTIDNNFNNFHIVPDDTSGYTRVAHKSSNTDMTEGTGGATITTTYDAYISTTQPADTYTGQVKYVMVHPYSADPDPYKPSTSNVTPPASCPTPVPNLTYMQDLNSSNKASILTNMTEDAQYYLADKRDDKSYCVAKLKDGNIWMTQNLDHDIDKDYNYTNQNTDIGWNSSTNSYDAETWTPVASTHITNDTEWDEYDEDTNPDGGDYYHAESYDPGILYWNGEFNPNDYDGSTNYVSSTGISNYHLGNYYNWPAAIAANDSSIYGYDDATGEYRYNNGESVNRSICPAGWTLPKDSWDYTSPESYHDLLEQYGWDFEDWLVPEDYYIWNNPLLFPISGDYAGELQSVGEIGRYWTSSIYDWSEEYMSLMEFEYDGHLSPGSYGNSAYGRPVRCLAR